MSAGLSYFPFEFRQWVLWHRIKGTESSGMNWGQHINFPIQKIDLFMATSMILFFGNFNDSIFTKNWLPISEF